MKILKKLISIMLSIILFFVLILFSGISFVSNFYSKEYYTNLMKNIDLDTVKLTDIGIDEEGTVEDYLVDELNEMGLEKDLSRKIIRSDEVKEVVGTFVADWVEYSSNGKDIPQISREDVDKVLSNDDVKSVIDEELTDEEINKLIEIINDAIKEGLNEVDSNA